MLTQKNMCYIYSRVYLISVNYFTNIPTYTYIYKTDADTDIHVSCYHVR